MNKRTIWLTAVVLVALLCGCKGELFELSNDNSGDGRVQLSIDAHSALSSEVTTRASDTDISGRIIVMVFDGKDYATAKLKQVPVEGTAGANGQIKATVMEETTASFISVLVNVSEVNKTYLLGLEAGATLADITSAVAIGVNASGLSAPFPSSGWSGSIAQIIKNGIPISISIALRRAVAQIDVDATVAQFDMTGVRLVNGAKRGFLLEQPILPYFGPSDVVTYNMALVAQPTQLLQGKVFCYENRGSQGNSSYPTRVVIYGRRSGAQNSSFYGIDLFYPETAGSTVQACHIQRNFKYTIKINKIEVDGYSSYEDAAKGDAFNRIIESEIIITDPYAYDVVSNGQQYLGITNAEYVLYPSDTEAVTNLLVATISYTCSPDWSLGQIRAPAGIELAEGLDRLEVSQSTSPIYNDIVIRRMSKDFTEGEIQIEIGNLTKTIKIRRMSPVSSTGQASDNYFAGSSRFDDYKEGNIINPTSETAWLKLSLKSVDEGGSTLVDKIISPAGGIYFHVQPYLWDGGVSVRRDASFFVSGERSDQRIRVQVQQKQYDFFSSNEQIKPYSYVGAFYRWNQTAERLIRMKLPAGTTKWEATVVSGQSFTILSTAKSPDTGLGIDPYGIGDNPLFATDDAIEASCQVGGNLRLIEGVGRDLYLRIGLTSTLSGPHADPRYGLIVIDYSDGTTLRSHNIYVRQGEAADYLMRPIDPSYSTEWNSPVRPKAIRLAPYNLTDPLTSMLDLVNNGTGGYNFVKYPSQGGYFFLSSGTQAIRPTLSGVLSGLTVPSFNTSAPWDKAWETCPRGYRRPHDGEGRAYGTGTNEVSKSEVRQSLWLSPMNGVERGSFSNGLVGFLADGYFDRRPIGALGSNVDLPNGVVGKGTVDAAYCGMLVFNPYNFASLFLPFSGAYLPTSGVALQGDRGAFQLSTPGSTDASGWLTSYGNFNSNFTFNMFSRSNLLEAHAVRCVKDDNPLIDTDDSQVELPSDSGKELRVATMPYTKDGKTFQAQFEARYPDVAVRRMINTLGINAIQTITDADYVYLNNLANESDHNLRHLVLRGAGCVEVRANAFTSGNWRSLSMTNVAVVRANAFSEATMTGLGELSFGYPKKMLVEQNAFAGLSTTGFSYKNTVLLLGVEEFKNKTSPINWSPYYGSLPYETMSYQWKWISLFQ